MRGWLSTGLTGGLQKLTGRVGSDQECSVRNPTGRVGSANFDHGGAGFGEFNYAGEACGKFRKPAYFAVFPSFALGKIRGFQRNKLFLRQVPFSLRDRR